MKRLSFTMPVAMCVLLAASFALAQSSAPAPAPGASAGAAQGGLDPASILKPLGENGWPTYCGDYTCKRYSSLDLINQSNVNQLSLAWMATVDSGTGPNGAGEAGGGRRGRGGGGSVSTGVGGLGNGDMNTGGPARLANGMLEVNGVLYVSAPDNVWAMDAHDGTILWHY